MGIDLDIYVKRKELPGLISDTQTYGRLLKMIGMRWTAFLKELHTIGQPPEKKVLDSSDIIELLARTQDTILHRDQWYDMCHAFDITFQQDIKAPPGSGYINLWDWHDRARRFLKNNIDKIIEGDLKE